MQYTYLSANSIHGLNYPLGEPDIKIFEDKKNGIYVILTSDATSHLRYINRNSALLGMIMRGMTGTPLSGDFPERLAQETVKVEQQQREVIGTDPVIIICINGEVDASIPDSARQMLDFVFCFDAFDKKALRADLKSRVSAILTAIRMGGDASYRFSRVVDGSYLTTDDGKIVHSVSVEGHAATINVSRQFTTDQIANMSGDIELAIEARGLERVMRLQAYSLNASTDNYRAFIAAWSALEILIGKLFPVYQKNLTADLRKVSGAPGLRTYLDRVASVMTDKHGLADKFAVLSVYLDEESKPNEIDEFRGLKRVRDQLSHGVELDESTLPTGEVQRLFDKYLRSHLQRDV